MILKESQMVIKESENAIKESQMVIESQMIIKKDYFCCFCAVGRKENRYSRELISYYMSIGVDKFVFIDNNLPDTEKFSDVLQDYIKNGTVDIIEMIGSGKFHSELFGILYDKYQNQCNWLTFFDFDEYLVLFSKEGKKLALKEYLSNQKFNNCEAIGFNWVNYGDNDLLYYDNRSSIERFTKPNFNDDTNRFVKSIIRGHLNKEVYSWKNKSSTNWRCKSM